MAMNPQEQDTTTTRRLHEWRSWAFDDRLPVGKYNVRAPFPDACGDCGRPKGEHPMDNRIGTMKRSLDRLVELDVPEDVLIPIVEWAERNLVGWQLVTTQNERRRHG